MESPYVVANEIVRSAFPGIGLISLSDASVFMGIQPKTARNWLVKNAFPIQTVKLGDKRFVATPSLVEWYGKKLIEAGVTASGEVTSPAVQTADAVKRGRGRPRKVALQQEGGV